MSILAWIIFGLITGIVANLLDPRPSQGGMMGALVLGILGALLGSAIATLIFGVNMVGFNLTSFVIAIAGSLILLAIPRLLNRA